MIIIDIAMLIQYPERTDPNAGKNQESWANLIQSISLAEIRCLPCPNPEGQFCLPKILILWDDVVAEAVS